MSLSLFTENCYVMDTGFFHNVQHYYPETFPSFWEEMDEAVFKNEISSVKEVRNELERYIKHYDLLEWIKNNKHIFTIPSSEEVNKVRQILVIPKFRNLIHAKNLRNGWPAADPFLIAKAWTISGVVVMMETFASGKKSPKIPDVCKHFRVRCTTPEGFMKNEVWRF